ncbi:MAG: hypothetical protein ACLUFT_06340 [Gemmiger formicilis]
MKTVKNQSSFTAVNARSRGRRRPAGASSLPSFCFQQLLLSDVTAKWPWPEHLRHGLTVRGTLPPTAPAQEFKQRTGLFSLSFSQTV